jgi:hypothetical protein
MKILNFWRKKKKILNFKKKMQFNKFEFFEILKSRQIFEIVNY